jgi:hypothetical protein
MTQPPGPPHPLGRLVNHDPRSRQYPFSARPEADVQVRSVRWTRRAPILDQGQVSSCTGNAAAGWLGTDDAGQRGRADITESFAVGLYSQATRLDPWDGEYPPDDTGSDGVSVCKVLQARGLIGSYSHCFGLPDVLAALQSGPVLVGTAWYDGMFTPGPRGLVSISGTVAGGHEYVAEGVDVERREVVFANSWGDGWGEAGHFRMSYQTLTRLLGEDGDATVPHAVVPADPDVPSPAPGRSWWQRWFGWLFQWLRGPGPS